MRPHLRMSPPWRHFALGVLAISVSLAAFTVPGAAAISRGAPTAKLHVVISEQGRHDPFPPKGKFVLEGRAGRDSGTTTITPGTEPARVRDGQSFTRVRATDHLTGKKGELLVQLTGISVSAGTNLFVEYGTWRILPGFGTEMYKGWRGGGRWAAVTDGPRYSLRLEGLVTS